MAETVVIKTVNGDKTVTIPAGWQRVPIDGDLCQLGDRFYNVNELRYEDAVQSDIGVSSFWFELLIRPIPKPSKGKNT